MDSAGKILGNFLKFLWYADIFTGSDIVNHQFRIKMGSKQRKLVITELMQLKLKDTDREKAP